MTNIEMLESSFDGIKTSHYWISAEKRLVLEGLMSFPKGRLIKREYCWPVSPKRQLLIRDGQELGLDQYEYVPSEKQDRIDRKSIYDGVVDFYRGLETLCNQGWIKPIHPQGGSRISITYHRYRKGDKFLGSDGRKDYDVGNIVPSLKEKLSNVLENEEFSSLKIFTPYAGVEIGSWYEKDMWGRDSRNISWEKHKPAAIRIVAYNDQDVFSDPLREFIVSTHQKTNLSAECLDKILEFMS